MSDRLKQFERVGAGNMAEVFRGALVGERGTDKPVAIKRLRAGLRDDPAAVDLFVREAKISLSLSHPHIVHALELIHDDHGYALVCEWLQCASLAELRRRFGPLPWPALVYVGHALARALDYLHKRACECGLVHRDVTPANVVLTADGEVKLGDFGVATGDDPTASVRVVTGGTPAFAAPEQLTGGAVDPRTDIFGLGATLKAVVEEIPVPLKDLLDRATAADPGCRFDSALTFDRVWTGTARRLVTGSGADALKHWLDEKGGIPALTARPELDRHLSSILKEALQPPATDATLVATPRPRRSWPVVFAVALLALGGVALWSQVYSAATSAPSPAPPTAMPADFLAAEVAPVAERRFVASETPVRARRPAAPKKTGQLSLNAIPWAAVAVDGRELGNTPLKGIELTEGRHVLKLVHGPQGLRREVVVDIEGGVTQTLVIDLRRGTVDRRVEP
ncbi:MAG: serine/threonine protein kinase [Deltaproteobacteria bacterium]|nr:serine/threonine protein kinase [Deltaproteobacteria bacterium]